MNLPVAFAFDGSAGLGPGACPLPESISFALSSLLALLFVAYLLRCYFQEFRRARRIKHRKRLARLHPSWPRPDREAVVEACRHRRESVMAPQCGRSAVGFDWRSLSSLIPAHERITLVWDTAAPNGAAPPTFHVGREVAQRQTITGNGEVTVR